MAGPQMKSQPSFDHQLAEDRLRAPRGEMNAGNSLPAPPQLWSSSQTPGRQKKVRDAVWVPQGGHYVTSCSLKTTVS